MPLTFKTIFMKNCCFVWVVLGLATSNLMGQGFPAMTLNGYDTTHFEDLSLEPDSYWNGADQSGGFQSGGLYFFNNYNPEWGSWTGWAYSNRADDTTQGYTNPYSAITAAGYDPVASGGSNYGVGFVPIDWMTSETIPITLKINDTASRKVEGFYVTNSTYAALSMLFGDDYSKKFGGETGDDPDWFLLTVWGYLNGTATDTVVYYLADYRFNDNAQDYIVNTWQWVELASLGKVDSLRFDLSSSDVGMFGMNTPAFFCVDNFYVHPLGVSVQETATSGPLACVAYPNPTTEAFKIFLPNSKPVRVQVFNTEGNLVLSETDYTSNKSIDISDLPTGLYLIRVNLNNRVWEGKIIKR